VDGEVSLTFRCDNSELGPFKALIQLLGYCHVSDSMRTRKLS
jgi:hypothetical protein